MTKRSGRLTPLARCTALCSARSSGGLRTGTSLERAQDGVPMGLGDPSVLLDALCRFGFVKEFEENWQESLTSRTMLVCFLVRH